jgi:hypothetical protein
MKTTLLLVALLSLTVGVCSAFAQDPGDIGLFFDVSGTQTFATINPGIPFWVYVVAFDTPGGIAGWEGSMQRDPSLLLGSEILTPGALNVGTSENWIVGLSSCLPGAGPTVLVTLSYIVFTPVFDVLFCFTPSTPSSFGGVAPGWLDCGGSLIPFGVAANGQGVYPDGCAVGNATGLEPVATDQESWGALKALYR